LNTAGKIRKLGIKAGEEVENRQACQLGIKEVLSKSVE